MAGWGKKYIDHRDLFLCECGSSEHQFIFQIYDWGKDEEYIEENPEENLTCSMSVHLTHESIYRRIKRAFKYIFGYRCRYGDWDEIILTYDDAQRLINGMSRYCKLVEDYRKKIDG